MSQTAWIVALSAVAVVSAVLSFVAWSLLARPPRGLPAAASEAEPAGDEAPEGASGDDDDDVDDGDEPDEGDRAAT